MRLVMPKHRQDIEYFCFRVPWLHHKNDNSQNACFPVCKNAYISNMRGIIGAGTVFCFASIPQQEQITADYLLCVVMNAYSVSVCPVLIYADNRAYCVCVGLSYRRRVIMQQGLYRRLAVGVMAIAFLLNDYQIITHAQNDGAGYRHYKSVVNFLHNGIIQVLVILWNVLHLHRFYMQIAFYTF